MKNIHIYNPEPQVYCAVAPAPKPNAGEDESAFQLFKVNVCGFDIEKEDIESMFIEALSGELGQPVTDDDLAKWWTEYREQHKIYFMKVSAQ